MRKGDAKTIELRWLPNWGAYAVRRRSQRVIGLVRCRVPQLPFREPVEFR